MNLHQISKRWLLSAAGLVVILSAGLSGSASDAKTTVAKNGDDGSYRVTVELAFAFLDQGAQNRADDLLKLWSEQLALTWNGPNGQQTFGDCGCRVTFDFKIQILSVGQDCRQAPVGYHCINVVDRPVNQRGNRADMHVVAPNSGWNGFGEWTTNATGADAAHEIGHLLGLKDEYHYEDKDGDGTAEAYVNDNHQSKDPQSIMAQSWGNTAALQSQIDTIMSSAGFTCPASCCCGNGKIESVAPMNEQCDPKATPNGCGRTLHCTEQCQCQTEPPKPKCGDGQITAPEECDDAKLPSGCTDGQACRQCLCQKQIAVPPITPATPVPPIADGGNQSSTEPKCGDRICDPSEGCTSCSPDCACAANQVCAADQCVLPECISDRDCSDAVACTADFCRQPGTAQAYCSSQTISVCLADDGCCPTGCTASIDADCPAVCGDEICSRDESCSSCTADCGNCGSVCGDDNCAADESCSSCAADCGTCPPICGDGLCSTGEDCYLCEQDCGTCDAPVCNDGQDNDGDGLVDFPLDPDCNTPTDETES
ncbi:MAG: hypothetical protein V1738_03785 [Patescibacteria group bacterium]